MKKYFAVSILILSLLFCFPMFTNSINSVYAKEIPNLEITLKGNSEIFVEPDSVDINAVVNLKDFNYKDLQTNLENAYNKILKSLKKLDDNVSVSHKSISIYETTCDEFTGYKGYLSLMINTENLNLIDKITLTCLNNGATSVNSNNYNLIDKKQAYNKALSLAITQAKEKASSIYKNFKIIEICEESSYDYCDYGMIKVSVNVNVKFEIIE